MARPKNLIKKRKQFNVRCTISEHLIIKKLAERHELSVSDYARNKLLEERVKPKMTEEEVDRCDQLVQMANDLKKIADHCQERPLMTLQLIDTLEGLNRIIRRL